MLRTPHILNTVGADAKSIPAGGVVSAFLLGLCLPGVLIGVLLRPVILILEYSTQGPLRGIFHAVVLCRKRGRAGTALHPGAEVEQWRGVRGHVVAAGLKDGRRLYACP